LNANNASVKAYISYPKKRKTDVAILYLSDIFGLGIINAYQYVLTHEK